MAVVLDPSRRQSENILEQPPCHSVVDGNKYKTKKQNKLNMVEIRRQFLEEIRF
jgi:hypothetical protein